MRTYKCSCCGEEIEAGQLTDLQLAAVGAVDAAVVALKAAGDTRLKSVFTPAVTAVEMAVAVAGRIMKEATAEQHVAMAWYLEHATQNLGASGREPS